MTKTDFEMVHAQITLNFTNDVFV